MKKIFIVLLVVSIFLIGSIVYADFEEVVEDGVSEAGVTPEVADDDNPLRGDGADNHKVEADDVPDDGEGIKEDIPCGVELDDLGHDYPDVSENETFNVDYKVSDDGKYLSWESGNKVSEVVVKGGPSANIYYYYDDEGNYLGLWNEDTSVWYDSGLRSPTMTNPQGDEIIPEISNFGFFSTCTKENGEDPTNGENGENGEEPINGEEPNGKPPAVGNGVFRTKTPLHDFEATPIDMPRTPRTGGVSLWLYGLVLTVVGICLRFKFQ